MGDSSDRRAMKRPIVMWVLIAVALFGCSDARGNTGSACTPGQTRVCMCATGGEGTSLCSSEGASGPCRCGDAGPDASPDAATAYEAYAACTPGSMCPTGLSCLAAMFASGPGVAGSLCATSCAAATGACVDDGSVPGRRFVCLVATPADAMGQCYVACAGNQDCARGTVCRAIQGTTAQICVP